MPTSEVIQSTAPILRASTMTKNGSPVTISGIAATMAAAVMIVLVTALGSEHVVGRVRLSTAGL